MRPKRKIMRGSGRWPNQWQETDALRALAGPADGNRLALAPKALAARTQPQT